MGEKKIPKTTHKAIDWSGKTVEIELYVDVLHSEGQNILNKTIGAAKVNVGSKDLEVEAEVLFKMQDLYLQTIWASADLTVDDIDMSQSESLSGVINERFAKFQGRLKL
jgi:hypothetical protein